MGWGFLKAINKVVKQTRMAVVRTVPGAKKLGQFVRNPAGKLIPHAIRKKTWYKKYGSKVIRYGLTAAATAGVGSLIGSVAIAKNIATGVSALRSTLSVRKSIKSRKVKIAQIKQSIAEAKKMESEAVQIAKRQKEIDQLTIKAIAQKQKSAEQLRQQQMDQAQPVIATGKPGNKPAFNVAGALLGAGAGALANGALGAGVGALAGGFIKKG